MIHGLYRLLAAIRTEFVPDPRVAVFDVEFAHEGEEIVAFGAVSVPAALEALRTRFVSDHPEVRIRDEIERLPIEVEGFLHHAIVRVATAPVLAGPVISESHLTQVLLGHRVRVLREHGRWLQCRLTDGYIGWIHRGYVHRVDEPEARRWEDSADHPLHVSVGAVTLDGEGEVLVRIPWGGRAAVDGEYVVLPDGQRGRLEGEMLPLTLLPDRFPARGEAIVTTTSTWFGAPYLWGGITTAGVDCSGLVQAVYRMHGIELPRDSDQQAESGWRVDPGDQFSRLLPGDLVFFAEERDRISHVAISAGGSRILHSALGNGGVRPNDLLGSSPYERELRSLIVETRRIIPREG